MIWSEYKRSNLYKTRSLQARVIDCENKIDSSDVYRFIRKVKDRNEKKTNVNIFVRRG